MRVLVIGAGIVGSIYGWALAEGGNDVVHLVREGRAATLRGGLPIDIFDRRRGHPRNFRGVYGIDAAESPEGVFDLVVLPVKHYALSQTLREIVPRVGDAPFVFLTQNWRGTAEVDALLPPKRGVWGDAKAGGRFAYGTLVGTLKGIHLGPAEGEPTPLACQAADLFASVGMVAKLHPRMLHYLWVQYALTGALWAALIAAGSFDGLLDDAERIRAALLAGHECLRIIERRGVVLSLYPETKPFLGRSGMRTRIDIWLTRWLFRHDVYTKRSSAHAFGDPREVQTFYDDLVGTGHSLGLTMPVMESYAGAIERFASTGGKAP